MHKIKLKKISTRNSPYNQCGIFGFLETFSFVSQICWKFLISRNVDRVIPAWRIPWVDLNYFLNFFQQYCTEDVTIDAFKDINVDSLWFLLTFTLINCQSVCQNGEVRYLLKKIRLVHSLLNVNKQTFLYSLLRTTTAKKCASNYATASTIFHSSWLTIKIELLTRFTKATHSQVKISSLYKLKLD